MTTPAERQRVLDILGKLYGFPFRPYTQEEWRMAQGATEHTDQGEQYQAWQRGPLGEPRAASSALLGEPKTERTDQGEQTILPGAERSARQAAASRESAGHGKIRPSKPQKDPGGLFAPKEPDQPKLF